MHQFCYGTQHICKAVTQFNYNCSGTRDTHSKLWLPSLFIWYKMVQTTIQNICAVDHYKKSFPLNCAMICVEMLDAQHKKKSFFCKNHSHARFNIKQHAKKETKSSNYTHNINRMMFAPSSATFCTRYTKKTKWISMFKKKKNYD